MVLFDPGQVGAVAVDVADEVVEVTVEPELEVPVVVAVVVAVDADELVDAFDVVADELVEDELEESFAPQIPELDTAEPRDDLR